MQTFIHQQVEAARAGIARDLICRVPSGWVMMCNMQYLPGYSILLPDPVVPSLNSLNRSQRADFLCDMALVGDALLDVTGAYRINYAIMGNSDPALHAHIVPRYLTEPEVLRKGGPWSYAPEVIQGRLFDPERDGVLVLQIAEAVQKQLGMIK
jgi:diadenosine tetraphosphate (Ap4A) HIT family hydrolase